MGRRNRESYRRRQKEAKERQAKRDKRSPEEQLQVLDDRLGEGVGASKERAKLKKEIYKNKKS